MQDDKIIEAIHNKDEEIMGLVIQKYSNLLWKIVSAVLINASSIQDVEECVADVFIHLWMHPEKYETEKGKLSTYLSIVARNKAIDRYRSNQRRKEVSLEENIIIRSELLTGIIDKEERKRLITTLNKLEEPFREVLVRRYLYNQKPREIMAAMGLPKKRIENLLYQGKQKLRTHMERLEGNL